MVIGAYYLGRSSNKPLPPQPQETTSDPAPPSISTIPTPTDLNNWIAYKINTPALEFKLPSDLARKYGKLTEKEVDGSRGSQVRIGFEQDLKSLTMVAQSPEYTPIQKTDSYIPYEGGVLLPEPDYPTTFQGFKIENGDYFGILPFGEQRLLPKEEITQYRNNGLDILKIKALYGTGMVAHKESAGKIWAIIDTGSTSVYPGLTIQGILDDTLTEPIFDQILSTFKFTSQ